MSGSELIRTDDATAAEIEQIRGELPSLVEQGDMGALREVAVRAEVVQKYRERSGHREEANRAGRLKIEAEAAIGVLDLKARPWGTSTPQTGPLVIDDVRVSTHLRGQWRRLGLAEVMGVLPSVLDDLAADEDAEISTGFACDRLKRLGLGWVSTRPFRERFKELSRQEGLTQSELVQRTGLSGSQVQRTLATGPHGRVSLPVAVRLADAMDMAADALAPRPWRKPRSRLRSRLRSVPRKKVTGGYAEVWRLVRLAQQALDTHAGESGNDALWQALHAAEDLAAERMKGRR